MARPPLARRPSAGDSHPRELESGAGASDRESFTTPSRSRAYFRYRHATGPELEPGGGSELQWKEWPQAQVPWATGLSMVKPEASSVSTKSIVACER